MGEVTSTFCLVYFSILPQILCAQVDNYTNIFKVNRFNEVEEHVEILDSHWNTKCKTSVSVQNLIQNFYNVVSAAENNIDNILLLRPQNVINTNQETVLKFNLSRISTTENILTSELYLYRLRQVNNTQPSIIRLYEIDPRAPKQIITRKPLAVSYMINPSEKYEIFNVKSSVTGSASSIAFLLTATDSKDNLVKFTMQETFLVLKMNVSSINIYLKQPILKTVSEGTSCKLVSRTINFNATALSPKRYVINFCIGSCDNDISNFNNHLKFLRIFNIKQTACCVPKFYLPLTVAHCDKYDNIVIKKYFNSNAASCECR